MINAPKQLSDLARINAHLSVRYRACGRRRVVHCGLLAQWLFGRCRNTTWSELPRSIPCPCGSIELSLAPIPCATSFVDPEMSRLQRTMVALAVQVLHRVGDEPATIEVRLAFHVLRPWVLSEPLVQFWQEAT